MNKAVGHDGIPAFFLKITASAISPYLLVPIKFSFIHGIFPDSCKIAKVVPSTNR